MVSFRTAFVIVKLLLWIDGNEGFSYGFRHTRVPHARRISSCSSRIGELGHPQTTSDTVNGVLDKDIRSSQSSWSTERNAVKPDEEKVGEALLVAKKIMNGSLVAPPMITAPLYGVGFGLFGYKRMWAFSEWIYKLADPSEGHLHRHFGEMEKFMSKQSKDGIKKSRCYRIHPTFAGLSLITTALLAFRPNYLLLPHLPHELLRVSNIFVCFVSAMAAKPLVNTMFGDAGTKKWNNRQGNLSMILAALTLCPSSAGRLMAHLNWSILFCGGFLQRMYVLCILPQLNHVSRRKQYIKLYSPQIKVATVASFPMGVVTFLLFN